MFLYSVSSFFHLSSVYIDRVIYFGKSLGDQVEAATQKRPFTWSPKVPTKWITRSKNTLRRWEKDHIEVKNMYFHLAYLDRVIHLGETLCDKVMCRSPKKLESFIEVPNVVHVIVHVLSFIVILLSTPLRVLRPSYPFRRTYERHVGEAFTYRAKPFHWGTIRRSRESICFSLQDDTSPSSDAYS